MKAPIYFLCIAIIFFSCSDSNKRENEIDISKNTSIKKDTIILKTPFGRFVNLNKEGGNYYVEWLQDNELAKLDSAFSEIEKGHARTPRFLTENEKYIILRAGCGNPCWFGIFLPLFKGGKPSIINDFIAFDLNSELVASIVKSDSVEIFNLRILKRQSYYLGKCESAFTNYCLDSAYFEKDKLIYEWKDSLDSKQIERRELEIK